MPTDKQQISAEDTITISRAEYEGLTAAPNPAPAVEEGPHLKDKAVREAKREQLAAAGLTVADPRLTDDMRSILKERK